MLGVLKSVTKISIKRNLLFAAAAMSSRALRRRLEREGTAGPNANGKDPQAVASTTSSDGEDNDNVDEYDELPVSSTVNAFDLLGGDADDADDVDDEDPGERDSAQAQDMDDDDDETAAPATLPPPRAAKPKRRKKKKKAKQSVDDVTAEADAAPSNDDDDDLDEVDRALRELNVQLGGDSSSELIPRTNITTAFCLSPLDELLAVDAQRLDPDAELRRLFGRSVLAEERQANAALPQAHRRRGPAAATSRYPGRYHLCSPQDTWPPGMARLGLEMELVGETGHGTSHDARTSPRQWFAFTHSTRYRDLEEQFMDRVATMIPE